MEAIRKSRSKLQKLGYFFVFVGLVYFVFSMSTKSWEPTKAIISFSSNHTYTQANAGPGFKDRMGAGTSFTWPSVKYEYRFNQKSFSSSIVCICIPIGIEAPIFRTATVYVAPYYPKLSVLARGPHFLLLLVFALFGGACFVFSNFLKQYEQA